MAEEHRKQPFDIVLALWVVPAGLVARRLQTSAKPPYVIWSLGSDIHRYGKSPIWRPVVRSVLRDAAGVFVNSEALARRIEDLSGRSCEFLATSRRLGPRPGGICGGTEPTFLFVGRLEPVKGPDVLLEATARIRREGWRLVLAGDGSMRRQLERRVERDDSLRGRVSLVGHLAGQDLLRLLYGCDCIVVPSRAESMPVVLSEGLQASKPFIVTDVGDLGAVVSRYGLGEVVPAESPELLARAMERFLAEPRGDLSVPCEALALFDIARSAGRFSEAAREIIG